MWIDSFQSTVHVMRYLLLVNLLVNSFFCCHLSLPLNQIMTLYILWCIIMIIPHLENSDKNLKFVLSQSWTQCQPVLITCSLWRVIIKEIIELNQSSLKGQRWNSATKVSKTKILKKSKYQSGIVKKLEEKYLKKICERLAKHFVMTFKFSYQVGNYYFCMYMFSISSFRIWLVSQIITGDAKKEKLMFKHWIKCSHVHS